MRPKLVALIAAAALTTGWLLASIVSPPVAELQGLPQRAERPAPPLDTQAAPEFTEQLNLRLQSAPAAPVPRRNPFVFGSATPRTGRDTSRSTAPLAAIEEPAPMPVFTGPTLHLSGIGSTTTDGGTIRTAIISDGRTVHLAKVGESVTGHSVIDITDDAVTIEDAAGKQWILRLK